MLAPSAASSQRGDTERQWQSYRLRPAAERTRTSRAHPYEWTTLVSANAHEHHRRLRVGGTGTYRVGQLVAIAPFPLARDATMAVMALLLCAGATWWIIRRQRRAPRRPDVGAVSTHWIIQHRLSRPDGRSSSKRRGIQV